MANDSFHSVSKILSNFHQNNHLHARNKTQQLCEDKLIKFG